MYTPLRKGGAEPVEVLVDGDVEDVPHRCLLAIVGQPQGPEHHGGVLPSDQRLAFVPINLGINNIVTSMCVLHIAPEIYLNVALASVGNFTNVEGDVNTFPGRADLLIRGLHWIKHWTWSLHTGKTKGQEDSKTLRMFTIKNLEMFNVKFT